MPDQKVLLYSRCAPCGDRKSAFMPGKQDCCGDNFEQTSSLVEASNPKSLGALNESAGTVFCSLSPAPSSLPPIVLVFENNRIMTPRQISANVRNEMAWFPFKAISMKRNPAALGEDTNRRLLSHRKGHRRLSQTGPRWPSDVCATRWRHYRRNLIQNLHGFCQR